ncbi:hypothetical protein E2P81_ATG03445 [Venturia nashicola]|nr:hypothetical protein E2P81_ATG03445 [Venturia nashicola]
MTAGGSQLFTLTCPSINLLDRRGLQLARFDRKKFIINDESHQWLRRHTFSICFHRKHPLVGMPGGLHPPISVIATWTPNYVNPETRGWGIVVLVAVLLALTYVVVLLRLLARFVLAKNAGIDDALIIFNMVPLTGLAVSLCLAFKLYGFDRHVWDSPIAVLINSRKITMALEALYLTSTATTKISILLFYRRLSAGTVSNGFIYSVYAAIAFVVVYYFIFMINLFIGCHPVEAFWLQANPFSSMKYQCLDEAANLIAAGVISVVQDLLACGMPMVLFWKLQIPVRQKFALGAIFGIGFFLCLCGALRIVTTAPIYYETYDMTWASYQGWIWFALESHLAVICASAPALKITMRRVFGGTGWSSLQRVSEGQKNGYSATSNAHSSATRRPDQCKDQTVTTTTSYECPKEIGDDERIMLPLQDVELGYMDREENHVKMARIS